MRSYSKECLRSSLLRFRICRPRCSINRIHYDIYSLSGQTAFRYYCKTILKSESCSQIVGNMQISNIENADVTWKRIVFALEKEFNGFGDIRSRELLLGRLENVERLLKHLKSNLKNPASYVVEPSKEFQGSILQLVQIINKGKEICEPFYADSGVRNMIKGIVAHDVMVLVLSRLSELTSTLVGYFLEVFACFAPTMSSDLVSELVTKVMDFLFSNEISGRRNWVARHPVGTKEYQKSSLYPYFAFLEYLRRVPGIANGDSCFEKILEHLWKATWGQADHEYGTCVVLNHFRFTNLLVETATSRPITMVRQYLTRFDKHGDVSRIIKELSPFMVATLMHSLFFIQHTQVRRPEFDLQFSYEIIPYLLNTILKDADSLPLYHLRELVRNYRWINTRQKLQVVQIVCKEVSRMDSISLARFLLFVENHYFPTTIPQEFLPDVLEQVHTVLPKSEPLDIQRIFCSLAYMRIDAGNLYSSLLDYYQKQSSNDKSVEQVVELLRALPGVFSVSHPYVLLWSHWLLERRTLCTHRKVIEKIQRLLPLYEGSQVYDNLKRLDITPVVL